MTTTHQKKRRKRVDSGEEAATREALAYLTALKKTERKTRQERKALAVGYYGKLANRGHSVDEFLAKRQKEREQENR